MNAGRVDALVDLAYGVLIFVSVMLIAFVGTTVGAAFGFGVLASYAIHVVWKMARFDPEWMTREVTEEVTENVERTVEDQLDEVAKQLEEVNRRIDRRPKSEELEEKIDEVAGKGEEEAENPKRDSSADGDSSNGSGA